MKKESIGFDIEKRSFKNDIYQMIEKLQNHQIFSFSKFADGEWLVIENKSVNNSEFWFDSHKDASYRQKLIDAFQYKNDRYHVGVSCPCCQNNEIHKAMKDFSGQKEEMLTWANIWVNSNYGIFLNEILPTFTKYDVYLIANENSNINNIPFEIKTFYPISNNAWVHNRGLIDTIKKDIDHGSIENALFLFCCGPFGNILCHELTDHSDKNTFLDIGSTLNPFFGTGFYRGYYRDYASMQDCLWGHI